MSGIVPENDRMDFAEFVAQADNDSRTTGLFLLLLAPRSDGFIRESILTVGQLPTGAIMNHIIEQSYHKLVDHNENRGPLQ